MSMQDQSHQTVDDIVRRASEKGFDPGRVALALGHSASSRAEPVSGTARPAPAPSAG